MLLDITKKTSTNTGKQCGKKNKNVICLENLFSASETSGVDNTVIGVLCFVGISCVLIIIAGITGMVCIVRRKQPPASSSNTNVAPNSTDSAPMLSNRATGIDNPGYDPNRPRPGATDCWRLQLIAAAFCSNYSINSIREQTNKT